MPEIDIGAGTFRVYAEEDTADEYALGAQHADVYRALALVDRQRLLVTASRVLDRQIWKTGYQTFEERVVVQNIIDASIELAIDLANGGEFQVNPTTAESVSSMSAGSVSISFRRGIYNYTCFPLIVQELLRDYLGASGGMFTPKSTGVADEATFPIDLGYLPGGM